MDIPLKSWQPGGTDFTEMCNGCGNKIGACNFCRIRKENQARLTKYLNHSKNSLAQKK